MHYLKLYFLFAWAVFDVHRMILHSKAFFFNTVQFSHQFALRQSFLKRLFAGVYFRPNFAAIRRKKLAKLAKFCLTAKVASFDVGKLENNVYPPIFMVVVSVIFCYLADVARLTLEMFLNGYQEQRDTSAQFWAEVTAHDKFYNGHTYVSTIHRKDGFGEFLLLGRSCTL